jgi:hypothetical protein
MTKREYFTALALNGYISKYGESDFDERDAKNIVKVVDLVFDELEKEQS